MENENGPVPKIPWWIPDSFTSDSSSDPQTWRESDGRRGRTRVIGNGGEKAAPHARAANAASLIRQFKPRVSEFTGWFVQLFDTMLADVLRSRHERGGFVVRC